MRRMLAGVPHAADTADLEAWLDGHRDARTIAAFIALPGEVDLAAMISRHPDRRWVYPRVAGDTLCFHVVGDPALDLATGDYGVREPLASLPIVEIREIDAFFCPGLAFDARGGRLGRGRGFYDRMLARARRDTLKIGVCHSAQRVDDTFPEPHDIIMDMVIFC